MAAAPRVQPDDYCTSEDWAALSARSDWRGLFLVAHCWLVISAAMVAGAVWPWTIPLGVVVVGNRQLGLFILMHDAAHGLLHASRKVNDRIGYWFCGSDLHAYRPYHLRHHRFVQQSEDPDLILSAPFPISRASLRRKIVRDLSGQTFYKQRLAPLVAALLGPATTKPQAAPGIAADPSAAANAANAAIAVNAVGASRWSRLCVAVQRQQMFFITNLIGLALFALAGYGWLWCALWLLPMATWLPLVTRLRNIAEHALVAENSSDPLRHARTTHASLLERVLIAPYWVNYHSEHHMFTQIPCWNLKRAHRILQRDGVTARMEIQPGYLAMLKVAAPA